MVTRTNVNIDQQTQLQQGAEAAKVKPTPRPEAPPAVAEAAKVKPTPRPEAPPAVEAPVAPGTAGLREVAQAALTIPTAPKRGRITKAVARLQGLAAEGKPVEVPADMYPKGWVELSEAQFPATLEAKAMKTEPVAQAAKAPAAAGGTAVGNTQYAYAPGTGGLVIPRDFAKEYGQSPDVSLATAEARDRVASFQEAIDERLARGQARRAGAVATPEPTQVGEKAAEPTQVVEEAAVAEIVVPKPRRGSKRPTPPPVPAEVVSAAPFKSARNFLSEFAKKMIGKQRGSAGSSVLTADSRVKIEEASISADVLLEMYREPTSKLRELLAGSVAEERMVADDRYAKVMLVKFFRQNTVQGLCTKAPVTSEADAHVRVIRAHQGPGVKIHPIVHAMWNADFDGDAMSVSFDPQAINGAKTAMNFLIGTDGKNKIDPDFFGLAKWEDGTHSVADILKIMFGDTLTKEELSALAKAIEISGDGKVDEGFRSMLMWVRAIGGRIGQADRDRVTAQVLTDIWKMNTQMRLSAIEVQSMWAYLGPIINDSFVRAIERGLNPELEHLLSKGSAPSSNYAYSAAVGGPIGAVAKRNAHFRFISGLTKIVKIYESPMFESPRTSAVTAETWVTKQMSGLASFEDAGRALAGAARDMVRLRAGAPTSWSDPAFYAWLQKFEREYNMVAIAMNAAIANWSLSGSIVDYERVSMPVIITTKGQEIKRRHELRSQFLKVYGQFTMKALFGSKAPKGWEDVRLAEYVLKNKEPRTRLGLNTDSFQKIDTFIGRLADLRTSFPREYNDRLVGASVLKASGEERTQEEVDKLKKREGVLEALMAHDEHGNILPMTRFAQMLRRLQNDVAAGREHTYDQDLNDLAEAFFLLGKEMFYFLGLHNPQAFLKSEIGLRFVNAKSVNELGSALYEAVARYRYEPIRKAEARIEKAMAKGDLDAINRAKKDLAHELSELASSSDSWAAIVAAYNDPSILDSKSLKNYIKGPAGGPTDIFADILFSTSVKTVKDKYINKLVRDNPALRKTHDTYEVAYGLFAPPSREFSGMRFSDNAGHTTLLENIKDANDKVNRWAKANWDTAIKDVQKARKKSKAGDLDAFLEIVGRQRNALVDFRPHFLVDAALSMNASFSSGEKNQQEDQSSYAFQVVNYMVNGGTHSDVTLGGDIALGSMSMEKFQSSPLYVASALTDPDFTVDVYDENGVDTPMNMMEIFGTLEPDEAAKWDWLEAHPRAAESLRMGTVNNGISNKTGFSYTIATHTLLDTMEAIENTDTAEMRAMKTLADRPGFYGMINLTVAMQGKKRAQVREEAIMNIGDHPERLRDKMNLIDVLRGVYAWKGNTLEFVRLVAEAEAQEKGIEFDWDRIENAYQRGEWMAHPLGVASLLDVRFSEDYQRGQVFHRLAEDLEKYGNEIRGAGIADSIKPADPVAVAALFNLHDPETLRSYNNAIQTLSGAKTAQSTSVNGAMSKLFAGLMVLARHTPPPCDAPAPTPIPLWQFRKDWHKYVGRNARITKADGREDWIPVNEVSWHRIDDLSAKSQQVYIEDTSACLDPTCPCRRHATADPSTNFGRNQSAAIGRFLTVIRSLSTEGLNLKVKTVGDDGTDSITKVRVFDLLQKSDVKQATKDAFKNFVAGESLYASPMAAARHALAKALEQAFINMKYEGELSFDDYLNVAQILVRPVYERAETGPTDQVIDVRVLSIGQVGAIINSMMNRMPVDLDMKEFAEAARVALEAFDVSKPLDVETVLAGARVATKMPYYSNIIDKTVSATERNFELMWEIQRAVKEARSEWDLDSKEEQLIKETTNIIGESPLYEWADYFYERPKFGEVFRPRDTERHKPRITGYFPASAKVKASDYISIGPRNSWIVNAGNESFVEIVLEAYKRGVNILLEGKPTPDQWTEIMVATDGMLDKEQGVTAYRPGDDTEGHDKDMQIGTFISTFDIRLNGRNAILRGGAFDAGVFRAPAKSISFFFESIANEFGLSDSEFAACKSWIDAQRFHLTGDYSIRASTAFAQFLRKMVETNPGINEQAPVVNILTPQEVQERILKPLGDGTTTEQVPFDMGRPVEPGSPDHQAMLDGLERYVTRIDEIDPETNLLMTGKPNEIIGWLAASWNGEVRYHPIRLYETGNAGGAPTEFTITSAMFNDVTQALELEWEYQGSMSGRTFKMFEDLYSADKFIGRPISIPDIAIDSGVKLAGMIAKASTASRRLFMRKPQLMTTLMYMARMEPFGYNLAENGDVLLEHPELKARLLSGDARIGEWLDAMTDQNGKETDIEIFGDDPELNAFANRMARQAIHYNINPTVVFASRYGGVPSEMWFNFQVLFEDSETYHVQLMKLMNRMVSDKLCPPSMDYEGTDTLFNSNLQILVPVRYLDGDGKEVTKRVWADIYGGFHFFDQHFTGASNAGARVNTYGLPQAWANMAGRNLSDGTVPWFRAWGHLVDPDAVGQNWITAYRYDDEEAGD